MLKMLFSIIVAISSLASAHSSTICEDLPKSNSFLTTDSLSKDNLEIDSTSLVSNNDKDPWYLKYLLPAVIALLIGIISFFLSQLYLRHLDKKRTREKYIGILRVIVDEIKRNLDLECQLHAYLYVRTLPTFSLSFFITDRIFSELTTVCLNFNLLKEIFDKYFEYRHIQNRIDRTIRISNELKHIKADHPVDHVKEQIAERRFDSERGGTLLLINGNIKVSFDLYNKITKEINSFVKKDKLAELPDSYLEGKYYQFQEDPVLLKAAELFKVDLNKRPQFYK